FGPPQRASPPRHQLRYRPRATARPHLTGAVVLSLAQRPFSLRRRRRRRRPPRGVPGRLPVVRTRRAAASPLVRCDPHSRRDRESVPVGRRLDRTPPGARHGTFPPAPAVTNGTPRSA